MRVSQKVATIVAIVVVVASGATFIATQGNKTSSAVQGVSTKAPESGVVRYQGEDGKTALELLKQHNPSVVTKSSSLGEYVVSINGNDGGGKKYWLYSVNGTQASESAGTLVTKSSDVIEWRLQ